MKVENRNVDGDDMPVDETPSVEAVKALIDSLRREDRANLRPWILARYDVAGNRQRGYEPPSARR